MRVDDTVAVVSSALFGTVTGWLIADMAGAVILGAVSAMVAFVGVRARIRPGVIVSVLVGSMAGGLIGSSVVEAICLPSSCQSLEIAGGLITAGLSFVGIGLVAALVARSFDEYNERLTTDD